MLPFVWRTDTASSRGEAGTVCKHVLRNAAQASPGAPMTVAP